MRPFAITFLFIVVSTFSGYSQAPVKQAPEGFDVFRADIRHGKIDTITYPSATVGTDRRAIVYLPPDFSKRKKYKKGHRSLRISI